MTEDEKKIDNCYLKGRIDALEEVLDMIIQHMPYLVLRSTRNELQTRANYTVSRRDADPVHIDWDMRDRSWDRPDRPPPITLRAEGYLSVATNLIATLSAGMDLRETGDRLAVLAQTPQARKKEIEYMRRMKEEGETEA